MGQQFDQLYGMSMFLIWILVAALSFTAPATATGAMAMRSVGAVAMFIGMIMSFLGVVNGVVLFMGSAFFIGGNYLAWYSTKPEGVPVDTKDFRFIFANVVPALYLILTAIYYFTNRK
jgi:hypothetical protein